MRFVFDTGLGEMKGVDPNSLLGKPVNNEDGVTIGHVESVSVDDGKVYATIEVTNDKEARRLIDQKVLKGIREV